MSTDPIKKKFLFVNRRAPYGTLHGRESIDATLMAAAFEQVLSVLYLDDGVFMLQRDQQADAIQSQNFSTALGNFATYGIQNIYVDQLSMQQRGLTTEDLLFEVIILSDEEIAELMDAQDIILSY